MRASRPDSYEPHGALQQVVFADAAPARLAQGLLDGQQVPLTSAKDHLGSLTNPACDISRNRRGSIQQPPLPGSRWTFGAFAVLYHRHGLAARRPTLADALLADVSLVPTFEVFT